MTCVCDKSRGLVCVYHQAKAKLDAQAAQNGTPTVTVQPSAYTVCAVPERFGPNWYRNFTITVERLAVEDRWRITHGGEFLTADGEWTPDRRRAVYADLDTALDSARRVAPDVVVGAMTARETVAMLTAREVAAEIGAAP